LPAAAPPAQDAVLAVVPDALATVGLPGGKPLDADLEALASRKRKIDPRWIAAGAVAALAVIIGVVWTSGDDEPAADAASPSAVAPAAAAASPAAAAPPTAAAAPAPTPTAAVAAPVAAPAPSSPAAATLAAAVTTSSAPAPAPARRARARDLDVEVGQVRVRGGGLAAKAVGSAIDDGISKIERCYADAVDRKPGIEGKLTFSFSIDKSGKATKVRKQGGNIKDAALQRCSGDAIQKIRFPKAKKRAAQVTLPLAYSK
jgi:type IV secretory pathway VirB10-like protein